MAARRSEIYKSALTTLRDQLSSGVYLPETRLAAGDLAPAFGLSPTPMREVLARLCGEGLIEERRGEGFYLRRLSSRDIAALSQLAAAQLRLAIEAGNPLSARGASDLTPDHAIGLSGLDAVRAGDRLLEAWVEAAGNRLLLESFHRTQAQLLRARQAEPGVISDLASELAELAGATAADRGLRARGFYARRVRLAGALADALDAAAIRR